MSTIELRKEVASQQYALDNCQDDMNQLGKIKEVDDFMDTIERMKSIDNDPSKVRCVFFFDN